MQEWDTKMEEEDMTGLKSSTHLKLYFFMTIVMATVVLGMTEARAVDGRIEEIRAYRTLEGRNSDITVYNRDYAYNGGFVNDIVLHDTGTSVSITIVRESSTGTPDYQFVFKSSDGLLHYKQVGTSPYYARFTTSIDGNVYAKVDNSQKNFQITHPSISSKVDVEGYVKEPDGTGIGGALVHIYGSTSKYGTTNPDGSYTITDVLKSDGAVYRVEGNKTGYSTDISTLFAVNEDPERDTPDLVLTRASDPADIIPLYVSFSGSSYEEGDMFRVDFSIENSGKVDSPITLTNFYLSENTSSSTVGDILVEQLFAGAITQGDNETGWFMLTVPGGLTANQTYYVKIKVNADGAWAGEDTTNNIKASTASFTFVTVPVPQEEVRYIKKSEGIGARFKLKGFYDGPEDGMYNVQPGARLNDLIRIPEGFTAYDDPNTPRLQMSAARLVLDTTGIPVLDMDELELAALPLMTLRAEDGQLQELDGLMGKTFKLPPSFYVELKELSLEPCAEPGVTCAIALALPLSKTAMGRLSLGTDVFDPRDPKNWCYVDAGATFRPDSFAANVQLQSEKDIFHGALTITAIGGGIDTKETGKKLQLNGSVRLGRLCGGTAIILNDLTLLDFYKPDHIKITIATNGGALGVVPIPPPVGPIPNTWLLALDMLSVEMDHMYTNRNKFLLGGDIGIVLGYFKIPELGHLKAIDAECGGWIQPDLGNFGVRGNLKLLTYSGLPRNFEGFDMLEAEVNFKRQSVSGYNVSGDADFKFLDILGDAHGSLEYHTDTNFLDAKGTGKIDVPIIFRFLAGEKVAVGFGITSGNQQSEKLEDGPKVYGTVRTMYTGNNLGLGFHFIPALGRDGFDLGTNLYEEYSNKGNGRSKDGGVETIYVPAGQPFAIASILWENGDTEAALAAPGGSPVYDHTHVPGDSAFGGYEGPIFYRKNIGVEINGITTNEICFFLNPEPGSDSVTSGDYTLTLTNPSGIGDYTVELLLPNKPPQITGVSIPGAPIVVDPIMPAPVEIQFGATDEDPADAVQILLFYDDDDEGFNGHLINMTVAGTEEEAYIGPLPLASTDSPYFWDTTGVLSGTYHIYAMASDGVNPPVYAYAPGTIAITHPDAPEPPTGLTVAASSEGIQCAWEHSPTVDTEYVVICSEIGTNGTRTQENATESMTEWTIKDVTPGRTYEVSVCAMDPETLLRSLCVGPMQVDFQAPGVNNAPQITSMPITEGRVGSPYEYKVEAEDPDGDALLFELVERTVEGYPDLASPPPGVTIDPDTGLIAFTPVEGHLGSNRIEVKVSDPKGGFDTQEFYIDIDNWLSPNGNPVFTTVPPIPIVALVDEYFEYAVEATDPEGNQLHYSLSGTDIPAGLMIDPDTGVLTWLPTTDDVGLYTDIVIEARDYRGGTGNLDIDLSVQYPDIEVEFSFSPDPADAGYPPASPAEFVFIANVNYPQYVTNYAWDFDDGTGPANSAVVRHVFNDYTNPADVTNHTFEVTLTVTVPDATGVLQSVVSAPALVTVRPPLPVPDFDTDPSGSWNITEGSTHVSFDASASKWATGYAWVFGMNLGTETGMTSDFSFPENPQGERFPVTLTVSGPSGNNSITKYVVYTPPEGTEHTIFGHPEGEVEYWPGWHAAEEGELEETPLNTDTVVTPSADQLLVSTGLVGNAVAVSDQIEIPDSTAFVFNFRPQLDDSITNYVLSFDGVDDRMQLPGAVMNGLNDLTIEFRGKLASGGEYQPFISVAEDNANCGEFLIWLGYGNDQRIRATVNEVVLGDVISPTPVADGNWHHYSIIRQGSNVRILMDGVVEVFNASGASTAALSVDPEGLWIGAEQDELAGGWVDTDFLKGDIDELRFWNYARSDVEIQADMDAALAGTEPGLVAYYPLNEGSGDIVSDLTANGYDGQLGQVTLLPSWNGGSLSFDGVDDLVELPAGAMNGLANFTFECRARLDDKGTQSNLYHSILSGYGGALADNEILFMPTGAFTLEINDTIYMKQLSYNNRYTPRNEFWHHYAFVRNGSVLTIYKDGDQTTTWNGCPSGNLSIMDSGLWLGNDQDTLSGTWQEADALQGELDVIRIWNTVRSQTDIQNNMSIPLQGNETGLIAYYPLDETEGHIAYDGSSNHLDGELGQGRPKWEKLGDYQWNQVTPSAGWSARRDHTALSFENKLWVLGGSSFLDDIWSSNDGYTWQQKTPGIHWDGRHQHASIVFDNQIWILGGNKDGTPTSVLLNDVWASNDGISWTEKTSNALWSARQEHVAVEKDGYIWVLGGVTDTGTGNHYLNDVYKSSDGINWNKITATDNMWEPRAGHASVIFDNKIWVLGGETSYPSDAYYGDVWFSTNGQDWIKVTDNAPWGERSQLSASVFDNKIWVVGGQKYGVYYNDAWVSDNGSDWALVTTDGLWGSRSRHTSITHNEKLFLLGGFDDSVNYNDVWYLGTDNEPRAYIIFSSTEYVRVSLSGTVITLEAISVSGGIPTVLTSASGSLSGTTSTPLLSVRYDGSGTFSVYENSVDIGVSISWVPPASSLALGLGLMNNQAAEQSLSVLEASLAFTNAPPTVDPSSFSITVTSGDFDDSIDLDSVCDDDLTLDNNLVFDVSGGMYVDVSITPAHRLLVLAHAGITAQVTEFLSVVVTDEDGLSSTITVQVTVEPAATVPGQQLFTNIASVAGDACTALSRLASGVIHFTDAGQPDLMDSQSGFVTLYDGMSGYATGGTLAVPGSLVSFAVGDYDNDGNADVFVLSESEARLYQNDGTGNFADVTSTPLDTAAGKDAIFADVDNDGDLDLYVVRNGANALYLNQLMGSGTASFLEAAGASGLDEGGDGEAAIFADVNLDGAVDCYVANAGGANVLYLNDGTGGFTPALSSPNPAVLDSYGAVFADFNNDGYPDLYVANNGNDALFMNNGDGSFADDTAATAGITNAASSRSCQALDYDNDGRLDIFVSNFGTLNVLYHNNQDGIFTHVDNPDPISGVQGSATGAGMGAAVGDIDNDGDVDIWQVNDAGQPAALFRNNQLSIPNAGWLKVCLTGAALPDSPPNGWSNSSAIGARVELWKNGSIWQTREVCGGSGWRSQNSLVLHFGLGNSEVVEEVVVYWPSGQITRQQFVGVNQVLELTETRQVSALIVTPDAVTLAPGEQALFFASAVYENDVVESLPAEELYWAIADDSVAWVDGSGTVLGLEEGETVLTATWGDITSCPVTITVSAHDIISLSITPVSASLVTGEQRQFTAIAAFDDSSTQDVTTIAQWASSDTNVATIGRSGIGRALLPGVSNISAVYRDIVSNTAIMEVLDASLTLTLSPPNSKAYAEQTEQSAPFMLQRDTGSGAETVNLRDVSWNICDPFVGWVTTRGTLLAGKAGQTTVQAISGGVESNTVALEVANHVSFVEEPPATATAYTKTSYTLNAQADGGYPPLVYTWYKEDGTKAFIGEGIPHILEALTFLDAGIYYCEANDSYGDTAKSSNLELIVLQGVPVVDVSALVAITLLAAAFGVRSISKKK